MCATTRLCCACDRPADSYLTDRFGRPTCAVCQGEEATAYLALVCQNVAMDLTDWLVRTPLHLQPCDAGILYAVIYHAEVAHDRLYAASLLGLDSDQRQAELEYAGLTYLAA